MENYHRHTCWSNVFIADSAAFQKDYAVRAVELGQKSLSSVEHGWQPIIYFTLYYGLRRSEVLGLKEDAFDFKNDTFEIRHTVVKHKTIVKKDRTKGKKKTMSYDLIPEVKEMVLDLLRQKAEYKRQFGADYKDDGGYIFTWPDGTNIRPDYITNRFRTVLGQRGLPEMRFHDLRHPDVKTSLKIIIYLKINSKPYLNLITLYIYFSEYIPVLLRFYIYSLPCQCPLLPILMFKCATTYQSLYTNYRVSVDVLYDFISDAVNALF